MQRLTEQELHNLGMNIVGKKLQEKGYEFVAINSTLKKHPQFVLFKKGEPTIFVFELRLLIQRLLALLF
jgi:hypothetical protein